MPAVRTLEPGESSGEVSAAVELVHDVNGVASQRAVNGAVAFLITGFEVGPAVVDELPKGRGSGTARAIDGGHENCSSEHYSCWQRLYLGHKRVDRNEALAQENSEQANLIEGQARKVESSTIGWSHRTMSPESSG